MIIILQKYQPLTVYSSVFENDQTASFENSVPLMKDRKILCYCSIEKYG